MDSDFAFGELDWATPVQDPRVEPPKEPTRCYRCGRHRSKTLPGETRVYLGMLICKACERPPIP